MFAPGELPAERMDHPERIEEQGGLIPRYDC